MNDRRPADPSHTLRQRPSRRPWIFAAVALAVILILVIRHRIQTNNTNAAGRGNNFPVPVTLGQVQAKDVPIYLDGLGTVQAFNTVTVRPRVDGQLVKVAFTEGQEVQAGDELARIDPAPYQAAVDQAAAKKAQDAAQLANARMDLQRYADLLKIDGTTQQTFDTQKALVDQLSATLKADQAAIDAAQVNLDYCTIHAPLTGRTGIRLVDQGNIVHASDTTGLVVLTQLKPISVVFTLPETTLRKLQASLQGNPALPVLAMSRDGTNILATGELAVVDNQIDTTTGTIKLKATFANENLRLWPGEFVNVRLQLEVRPDSLVVPASVVQRGPEGAFAFVIAAPAEGSTNQIAKMRPLQVAQIDNGEALIDAGLEAGDTVVVDGQYKLQDGSPIRVVAPDGHGGHRSGAGKPAVLNPSKQVPAP